jgi:hypothetical protein
MMLCLQGHGKSPQQKTGKLSLCHRAGMKQPWSKWLTFRNMMPALVLSAQHSTPRGSRSGQIQTLMQSSNLLHTSSLCSAFVLQSATAMPWLLLLSLHLATSPSMPCYQAA